MRNIHYFSGRLGNEMFRHAYIYAQVRKGIIPDLYLQSPEFFAGFEDEIKKLFGEGIGYLEQVGVHIRRGLNPAKPEEPKYSENPFYTDLTSTNYYERAMAIFPNDDFLVFSDDTEFCRKKFKDNKRVQVMDRGGDIEDFNLLASCKSIIMANSSFSWWAGFLNPNPSKIVVAPIETKYYKDGIIRTKYPKEFKQIDFNKKNER